MIPDGNGGFEKHLNKPRITKKDVQYYKNLQESEQAELVAGRKLLTTKKGKVDQRSKKERTPAQIKATQDLVERARKRREDKAKLDKKTKQEELEDVKTQVHNSIVEVIKTPAHQIKKKEHRVPPVITDEDRQRAKQKRVTDLFS